MSIEIKESLLRGILERAMAEDYPDECVGLFEGWELIARIFYESGLDDVLKLRDANPE